MKKEINQPAPFGTLLGIAPGNVPAYSSDYDTVDNNSLPNRSAFRSYIDGVYLGFKWQCVEFARRWLYINKRQVFEDVAMAYEIFRLTEIKDLETGNTLPLKSFRNGSKKHPEPGAMLIWSEGGEFERTGHVAIITEVFPDRVRLAEQNVDHIIWPEGQNYSREIPARITDDGGYWLRCSFNDAEVLGWVIQTSDDLHAEKPEEPSPDLFTVAMGRAESKRPSKTAWLNEANPDEEAYVKALHGHKLASKTEDENLFYVISETAFKELERASNELHAMFMHATEYVLQDDRLQEAFNIPRVIWPKIQQSWSNRKNQMITGRFDFAMTPNGIKVYEYNCDSASCHMEAGKVQGKWAHHYSCNRGYDAGKHLWENLVTAWKESEVDSCVHILIDNDKEELYHGLFMKDVIEAAGIECKLVRGMAGLQWQNNNEIVDADGTPIRWVWKSWAWETALDQIRAECEDDQDKLDNYTPQNTTGAAPRLVDVLLRPEVMVFEPLWTLIPSNKAILPVMWQLFANQRFLLKAGFELNDEIKANGYVVKPIVGRCGANISLFDQENSLLEETGGQFGEIDSIYQEFFALPVLEENSIQLCTFTAAGLFAGACTRMDASRVITSGSDVIPLRVVSDHEFTRDYLPFLGNESS